MKKYIYVCVLFFFFLTVCLGSFYSLSVCVVQFCLTVSVPSVKLFCIKYICPSYISDLFPSSKGSGFLVLEDETSFPWPLQQEEGFKKVVGSRRDKGGNYLPFFIGSQRSV